MYKHVVAKDAGAKHFAEERFDGLIRWLVKKKKTQGHRHTYVVVSWPLVQDACRECCLKLGPGRSLDHALSQDGPNRHWIAQPGPAAIRSIAYHAVQPRYPHITQVFALQALGVAHQSVPQRQCKVSDFTEVAQIHGQAEDVDSCHDILPGLALGSGAGPGLLSGLHSIGAQFADGLERFVGGSRRRDNDKMRAQGTCSQEVVYENLNSAETNAAAGRL